jgi:hypothetical protein
LLVLLTGLAILVLLARLVLFTRRILLALLLLRRLRALLHVIQAEIIAIEIIIIIFVERILLRLPKTLWGLFLLARAIVGKDPKIMIGKLQIIFHIHPVAGQL